MLKVFCLTAVAIFLCVGIFLPANALAASDSDLMASGNVNWVRVTKDGVKLYANEDTNKVLFILEKTYYLSVIAETTDLYWVTVMQNQVDFPTISGCVKKDQVTVCKTEPVAPYYPTVKVTVNADSTQIKLSPTPSSETIITVTNTQKMAYYGSTYYYDDEWYYVCFYGKFGYVSAASVSMPVIAAHPTPLEQSVVAQPNDPSDTTPPSTSDPTPTPGETAVNGGAAAEIVLIVFVVLLAAGVCLALFLPGNLKKKADVFDSEI